MKRKIGSFVLRMLGWKLNVDVNDTRKNHCVLIAAPHTSNWDFIYAIAALWKLEIPVRFLIKDFYTRNVLWGWLFKALGGIGVNRSQRNNLTDYVAQLLKENDNLSLLLTPEGTRSRVDVWKSGFYKIAREASLPIGIAYLDASSKTAGVMDFIEPTDDYNETLDIIRSYYRDVQGVNPENWNPNFQ